MGALRNLMEPLLDIDLKCYEKKYFKIGLRVFEYTSEIIVIGGVTWRGT